MIDSTPAIVINTIKFGDTSVIATCFTKTCGVKSYLLKGVLKSKKGNLKIAYFQPLMHLNIIANHNNKGLLNSIKEVEVVNSINNISTNITKQSIALFLSEVLYHSIKEEEQNIELYEYLESAVLWLENHASITNFHLLFLLNLTRFLGFYPQTNNREFSFFDLQEGEFVSKKGVHTVTGENLTQFKKLLGINFDVLHKVDFNANTRQMVLSILIQYFELHLNGFKKPKSLDVLKSVFH